MGVIGLSGSFVHDVRFLIPAKDVDVTDTTMTHLQAVVQTMRGPFLLLPPVCILLGIAAAHAAGAKADALLVTLIVLGGVLAHISVNMFNEYQDFTSGLDLHTRRTPFSGGSGALPAQPQAAQLVLAGAVLALLLMAAIGVYFVLRQGPGILPFGLLGAALIVFYTGQINRSPLLCLIAPGLGFGILMVAGTQWLLSGGVSAAGWLLALVPFFLVNNLLLLNQFPDTDADRQAGRYHALIAWGPGVAAMILLSFWLAAALVVVAGVAVGLLTPWALLTVVAMLTGVPALRGAFRYGTDIGQQPALMAANVVCTLVSPLVLALTLLF